MRLESLSAAPRKKLCAEVAIVGASLAGSACAIELARQDVSVIVIDRSDFPRRKACGEGLSRLAVPYLNHLGVTIPMLESFGSRLFGYSLRAQSSTRSDHFIETSISSEFVRCYGVSRTDLDTRLLQELQKYSSATVLAPETVTSLSRNRASWEIATNSSRIVAKIVILANGAHSQAFSQGLLHRSKAPSERIGISGHARIEDGALPDKVVLVPLKGGEIYITPLPNGAANVSLVGTKTFVQSRHDKRELLDLIHRITGLKLMLTTGFSGASGFESQRKSLDPYLYLVGDALESFDPACGLGMTHALASGITASGPILNTLRYNSSARDSLEEYAKWQRDVAAGIRRYSGVIQSLIRAFNHYPSGIRVANRCLGGVTMRFLDLMVDKLQPKNGN